MFAILPVFSARYSGIKHIGVEKLTGSICTLHLAMLQLCTYSVTLCSEPTVLLPVPMGFTT